MTLTVKQAARILHLSDDDVMELVSAGRLQVQSKGKGLVIGESSLGAFLLPGGPVPLAERLASLEKLLAEKFDLFDENRQLSEQLRSRDVELARKQADIDKLERDLLYQKKLLEKEIEDRARALDERKEQLEREISDRIAREREEFDRRLAGEKSAWVERLAVEKEKYDSTLAQMREKEGFWSRLMRMVTWT